MTNGEVITAMDGINSIADRQMIKQTAFLTKSGQLALLKNNDVLVKALENYEKELRNCDTNEEMEELLSKDAEIDSLAKISTNDLLEGILVTEIAQLRFMLS